MCLAQGHNAVTPVRLEPAAIRTRVKHFTTEPLRSQLKVQKHITPYHLNEIVEITLTQMLTGA